MGKREETQDIAVNWHVAMRPSKRKVLDKSTPMGAIMDQLGSKTPLPHAHK
ncbi:hypothetical protein J2X09_004984 [Hydrogenophaga laconesensis]|uniref:Uncharacterized protein n=1 Tax=Hydrogenophaga laconesensis TaxID=1805971 RepID=A0ABU1VIA9_9BURK|nr:hypothetical protein [Hydrogenophaga laconesensis]